MRILQLDQTSAQHTQVILSLIVQSKLDYGVLDEDIRLLAWQSPQSRWAVAVDDNGTLLGIVCVVHVDDMEGDALLWLEVLPPHQRQGVGRGLLSWAQTQSPCDLIVRSVPGADGFYCRVAVPHHYQMPVSHV